MLFRSRVFDFVEIPYPVLVLRNSFSIIDAETSSSIKKLGFELNDLFKSYEELFVSMVKKKTNNELELNGVKDDLKRIYGEIKSKVTPLDKSLVNHTDALLTKALNKINALEKKMLRAEKKKHQDLFQQIEFVKSYFFPKGILQERVENVLSFYTKYGSSFIDAVYDSSRPLGSKYCNLILQ